MTSDHEHDEALTARLRAAAPIDPHPIPLPDGPQARSLLESIMEHQSTIPPTNADPGTDGAPGSEPRPLDPVLFGDRVDATYAPPTLRERPKRRGGFGLAMAAAAAVVILAAGALSLLPSNTEPALAAVQSAAQATAGVGSGRMEVTVDANTSADDFSDSVDAAVSGRFDGPDIAFTVENFDVTSTDDEFAPGVEDELPVTETRYVDGVLYADLAEEGWVGVEVPQFVGNTFADLTDPREVLSTVENLVDATEIGPETITDPDGSTVATTHYQSIVDLGDESLASSGWVQGLELSELDADGEVTVDFYVDDDGLLRRLVVGGDLDETGGTGEADFAITTSFYDLGGDVDIEAPEGAEILDPMEEFGDEFGDPDGSLFDEIEEELDPEN